jgi:hypothetical protein
VNGQLRQAPLRIYLDTSDYSRFADIGYRNEQGLPAILDFLREKRAQGLIEIRFSEVHLSEFLKDPNQRTLALRKAQIMEELCGDLVFRSVGDVFEAERNALRSEADPESFVLSNEGEWFPSTTLDDSFNLDTILARLQKSSPTFNAEKIRASLKTPEATASLKKDLSEMLPLSPNVYGSNLLERFLSSSVSGKEMAGEMMKGVTKPSILIGYYLEGRLEAKKLFSRLAPMERQIYDNSVRIREGLKPHIELVLGLGENVVKKARQSVKEYTSEISAPYLGLDELPAQLREAIVQGRFLEELPATSTHCNLLTAYIKDVIYPSSSMPKIKESDSADILHATYFPYVDLYRTDGRFSSLVSGLPKPSRVKVVANLQQLPDAIERELEKRSKTSAG